MASQGGGSITRTGVIALLAVPAFFLSLLFAVIFTSDSTAQAACNLTGSAILVDPTSVPTGPVAGYSHAQLVNAAYVMLAAQRLGLTVRDQQIGVMTAMGESSLTVLDHGDAVGPDSRGLFQQRDGGAWGTLADRLDPFISSTNYFTVEMAVLGRESMDPSLVAHTVQGNADPYYYQPFWEPAGLVVQALAGVQAQTGTASQTAQAGSTYTLGEVQPQTVAVANTIGPMFGIKTIGGYRAGADAQDHGLGLALDFMINDIPDGKAVGDRLSTYLQDHAGELGVKYVIWQQHIWSVARADEGWRLMEDRGSPTQNHMDHVHLSLTGTGSNQLSGCKSGAGQIGDVAQSGWAAPAHGPITSGYGPRGNCGGICSTFHYGIDIGAACDAPIFAANAGTVVYAGAASGYGNLIEIDHGNGVHTRYGHMYNDGLLAHVGDQVTAGQQIARVGSNGNSTGCHLHFEVLMNGQHVDPAAFLSKVGVSTN